MIAGLRGKLAAVSGDSAIVDVNGIAFQVYMPTSTLSSLSTVGEEVTLHTHLHLREDNATLYGFGTADELRLFQTFIGVSGLGPKLALAMLSSMRVEQLILAIASGSADLLTEVPGIGKKMANRLVLELKEKIGSGWITTPAAQIARENEDVLTALTSLGYSVAEATQAMDALPVSADISLEEKIKLALQHYATQ